MPDGGGGVWPIPGYGQRPRRTVPKIRGREDDSGSTKAAAADVVQLIIDYAKQETLGPLKGLGRFVAFGLIGAFAISTGTMLLLLALLRALQTETGSTFRGNWSWAPYLLTSVVAIVVLALAAVSIKRGVAVRRSSSAKRGA